MRYDYHDASPQQFEALVIEICMYLLGAGVQGFSTGPDEGRDARFEGTAERFPSKSNPHSGSFVIQAKHTEHPFAKFSDAHFSGESESTVLQKEIPRIRNLVELGELDHYLLFANRRLGGQAERELRGRFKDSTGVSSVNLFGVESIDRLLKRIPRALERASLSELKQPLRVTPDDLAEVICALDKQRESFREVREELDKPIHRTTFKKKNEINRLGASFAQEIVRTYLREFGAVRDFLAHPDNDQIKEHYLEAVAEFNEQILAHRDDDQPLERLLVNLQKMLSDRDSDLRRRKRLTKLVLYYMYWVCDIGEDTEPC